MYGRAALVRVSSNEPGGPKARRQYKGEEHHEHHPTRLARLTAASVMVVGLGALAASPAQASYSSWAGSVPPDASPELVWSASDDATPNGGSTWAG